MYVLVPFNHIRNAHGRPSYCVMPQFVYPFTLEQHVLTLESSRRSTIASHNARHEALLKQREEEKERRKREALRRIAPGFEPSSGPLVPDRVAGGGGVDASVRSAEGGVNAPGHTRQRSVMDDLVDQLAAMDAASNGSKGS